MCYINTHLCSKCSLSGSECSNYWKLFDSAFYQFLWAGEKTVEKGNNLSKFLVPNGHGKRLCLFQRKRTWENMQWMLVPGGNGHLLRHHWRGRTPQVEVPNLGQGDIITLTESPQPSRNCLFFPGAAKCRPLVPGSAGVDNSREKFASAWFLSDSWGAI